MALKFERGKMGGVMLIQPAVFADTRGYFMEMYHAGKYQEAGLKETFVQDNISLSRKHVLRGMHMQKQYPQGKLVSVMQGTIWDVIVDLRKESPTYRQWDGFELSSENRQQLYIPPGFAHGFVVLSELAIVLYKCTELYRPDDECGFAWNDPVIGIDWPVVDPILSDKDRVLPVLG